MAKKTTKNGARHAWNKGVEMGPREPFSPSEVARIKTRLAKRGDAGLRDLALFSIAIDTMLRPLDLLGLTVKDVRKRNRVMRDTLDLATANNGRGIQCTLSNATMSVLERWINQRGKKPGDYLFTGRGEGGSSPLTSRQLGRLVKKWTVGIGLDPARYGTHSLRRARAIHILRQTGNLEAIRDLLGYIDVASTAHFLRGIEKQDSLRVSRSHEL